MTNEEAARLALDARLAETGLIIDEIDASSCNAATFYVRIVVPSDLIDATLASVASTAHDPIAPDDVPTDVYGDSRVVDDPDARNHD